MFTFNFEISNLDRLYIQVWFEFWKNEYRFILEILKLVKTDKMVKIKNVEFWLFKCQIIILPLEAH